jgi:PIN domain nuclease of toxin-antitoxin system
MRLLLDTNAVIWWLQRNSRLGEAAQRAIATADEVAVSSVSAYEISFKSNLGKLRVPDTLEEDIDDRGFRKLSISLRHAKVAGELPLHNRDPFDRLLVAQARCEGMTLVTADRQLSVYDVPILDAAS